MFGNSNANSPNNAATFLPLINNERAVKSSTLREGLARLKLFAMVMWRNDTTVKPKESSHFQFFYPDQVGLGLFLKMFIKIFRPLKLSLSKSPPYTCKTGLDLDTSKIKEHSTGWKWRGTTWTFNLAGSHKM